MFATNTFTNETIKTEKVLFHILIFFEDEMKFLSYFASFEFPQQKLYRYESTLQPISSI